MGSWRTFTERQDVTVLIGHQFDNRKKHTHREQKSPMRRNVVCEYGLYK